MPIPKELLTSQKRVLVIDDDVSIAKFIMLVFQADGWEVFYAADGFQAGLTLAKTPMDLITLDLMMPTMDGFTVLSVLSQDSDLKKIPVLVVSGGNEELLNRAKQAGAADTLIKPIDGKKLIDVANKLTGQNSKTTSNLSNSKI